MNEDPFARFERSRSGLLIPLVLFLVGAVPTVLAARAVTPLVALSSDEAADEQQGREAVPGEVELPIPQRKDDTALDHPGWENQPQKETKPTQRKEDDG